RFGSQTIGSRLEANTNLLTNALSGCQNACSQHHVFDVGVIGINKGGKEVYQIVVGGDYDFVMKSDDNVNDELRVGSLSYEKMTKSLQKVSIPFVYMMLMV
ncbi:MAG: hypothetical protein ACTS6A_03190, partial [Candidatus Hodgkinia cicadicola]